MNQMHTLLRQTAAGLILNNIWAKNTFCSQNFWLHTNFGSGYLSQTHIWDQDFSATRDILPGTFQPPGTFQLQKFLHSWLFGVGYFSHQKLVKIFVTIQSEMFVTKMSQVFNISLAKKSVAEMSLVAEMSVAQICVRTKPLGPK